MNYLLSLLLLIALVGCPAAHAVSHVPPSPNATHFCNNGIQLEWTARVGSSIISTPRIVDLMHEGRKEILIPTFSHYFEALSGLDGQSIPGFPFVHSKFKTYATPLPVDMDGDGRTEWLVAMYTGELMIFTQEGKSLGTVPVPPLVVKKNWMKLENATLDEMISKQFPKLKAEGQRTPEEISKTRRVIDLSTIRAPGAEDYEEFTTDSAENLRTSQFNDKRQHPLQSTESNGSLIQDTDQEFDWDEETVDDDTPVDNEKMSDYQGGDKEPIKLNPNSTLSPEAKASMNLLFHPEWYQTEVVYDAEEDAFSAHNLLGKISVSVEENEIAIDAHILSTPVITDVDKNGDLDVIVHVSYFFDMSYYQGEKRNQLPKDIDPDDYVATAVLCINLVTGELKWIFPLELTSNKRENLVYAFSSPLIINADQDSDMEIFITSSTGRIVRLSAGGEPLLGNWATTRFGSISASPTAEDIQGNGEIAICTGDVEGSIACFTPHGDVIWRQKVIGGLANRVSFGDINGDGVIDVVFGTTAGLIYALDGRDGHVLNHFPITTGGPIISPVLLMNVKQRDSQGGLHVIVPSHDGNLYVVDAVRGCIESFDIDEKSSTIVLADDLTGNGLMDLVVTTIGGGVYVFETKSPFHPAKVWASETKGINGYTASENYVSISIDPDYRVPRDIRGDRFKLKFSIKDPRIVVENRQYTVLVYVGSRVLLYKGVFYKPNTYTIEVNTPLERMYSSLTVILSLPSGQVLTDTISLSFNIQFLETIKYTLVIPFVLTATALMFVRKQHAVDFSRAELLV
ncbi:unnamed protein product [Phytomonas sp. Hart1]|nr:unnamed protein product [Phytomonas sp. Hart1]|eukprot:CCW71639.1 unnamed protein product [Phytomonas sp. isolate Hart1]